MSQEGNTATLHWGSHPTATRYLHCHLTRTYIWQRTGERLLYYWIIEHVCRSRGNAVLEDLKRLEMNYANYTSLSHDISPSLSTLVQWDSPTHTFHYLWREFILNANVPVYLCTINFKPFKSSNTALSRYNGMQLNLKTRETVYRLSYVCVMWLSVCFATFNFPEFPLGTYGCNLQNSVASHFCVYVKCDWTITSNGYSHDMHHVRIRHLKVKIFSNTIDGISA